MEQILELEIKKPGQGEMIQDSKDRVENGEEKEKVGVEDLKQYATKTAYGDIFNRFSVKVLGNGFVGLFLANGFIIQLSALFQDLQDTFQKSKAETAIVQSVASGTFLCGGLFSGLFLTKFGIIQAGLIGASLTVLGLAISFFATSIPYLVVSLGLMTGLGTAFSNAFVTSYVGSFFNGKQNLLAFGIITTGPGIGGIIFPYLIDYLSSQYNFRGALLILSAMMSHCFVVVLLASNDISIITASKALTTETRHHKKFTVRETCHRFSETLKNTTFLVFLVSQSLTLGTDNAVLVLFVDNVKSKGFERSTAVFAYVIINIASLFSRILPGTLKQIPHVSVFDVMALGSIIVVLGYLLLPFSKSYLMLISVSSMLGTSLGIRISMKSVGPMAILGSEKFAIGQGISLTLTGVFTTAAGPLMGLVKDLTDSYDWVFYGVCLLSGITAVVLISIRVTRTLNKPTLNNAACITHM